MIKNFLILLLAAIASLSINLNAQTSLSEYNELGIWQGVMDGEPGEGGLFYRLDFSTDGSVEVTKQYGGANVVEKKTWVIINNEVVITSLEQQSISDFDNARIYLEKTDTIRYEKGDKGFYINKWNRWGTLIHWVLILVVLIFLNEIFRRYKYPTIVFFFFLPIVLIPLWGSHGVSYWFKWVKLYSVVFAAVWFTLIRYTKLGNKNFAKFIAAAFLAVNIAEAVMQDFSMGFWANILNAIGGIFSIITLSGYKAIHADSSKEKDMVWPAMTTFWIIAYDIWNFVFVYLNFPGSAGTQFMVLFACTLPSLFIKKGTWLQARAFTLAAWFMYYFTAPLFVESHIVLLPRNDGLMLAAGLLSFVANTAYAIIHFRKKLLLKNK